MEVTRIRMSFSILQMLCHRGITKEDVFKNTLAIAMLAKELQSLIPNVTFYENSSHLVRELVISFSTVGLEPTFVAALKDRLYKSCEKQEVRLWEDSYSMMLNAQYIDSLRMSLSENQPNGVK